MDSEERVSSWTGGWEQEAGRRLPVRDYCTTEMESDRPEASSGPPFLEPQFPYLYNRKNNTYFVRCFEKLNEVKFLKLKIA